MWFSGKKVKKILEKKSGQDAIIAIDNLLTPIFYSKPEKLSIEEKQIVFIEELEREVNNGGFNQFFFNSSGDFTDETILALKDIKSVKFLNLLESAKTLFPDAKVPKDITKRQNILEQIEDKANPEWGKINQEFCKYEEDIYSLMTDYIQQNISEFR